MCDMVLPIFIPIGGGSGISGYAVPKRLVVFKVEGDYFKIKVRAYGRKEAEKIVLDMIPNSTIVKIGVNREDMVLVGMTSLLICMFLFLGFIIIVGAAPFLFDIGEPFYGEFGITDYFLRILARLYAVICVIVIFSMFIRAWRNDARCP